NDSSAKPATEPQQQPQQQQQQGGGGNKKKGKKKRKATTTVGGGQGNDSVPTTPTTPTTHSSPLSDTPVEVTKDEVDRLVVLIESVAGTKQVASGTERTQADDVAIKELNGQIEKLRSEVDELKTKLSESEKASEATSKDFTEQIEKLKAEASQLETTLKAVEEERDKLKKDLDAKEQEMALAVSELEKKLAESDTAKNEQSARSEELDKALKDSRTSLLTLSKKHASDMDAQNQKLEEATSELAGLKKQVKEVSVLQERSEKAKASAAKLEKELRDCQSKLTSLETELTTSQKECADLKKSAGSFKEERSKLASTLAKAQGASARLENKQQELQVQLAKLTTEREKEKQRADAAEKSLKSVNEEHAKARESIEAGSKTIADKERQLADTQAKLAELEEHVRTIDVDLANSRELFSEKSRLLAQTTAQLQEMQYSLEKEKRAAKSPQGSGPSISSPSSRSNSLTMASVSALLRAATGNAAASGGIAAGRRASTQSVTTSPTTFTSSQSGTRASRMHPQMSHNGSVEEEPGSADLVSPTDIDTAGGRPKIHRPKSIDTNGLHTRSSSRSGSISEGFSGDDTRGDSSSVNVEYLRNVLFRFFNDKERRSQLVPLRDIMASKNPSLRAKFMVKAVPIGALTQCRLVRTQARNSSQGLTLFDEGDHGLVNGAGDVLGGPVMQAVKQRGFSKSYYNIYLPGNDDRLIGRVVYNHKGTVFSVLERTSIEDWSVPESQVEWREVCLVTYETNASGRNSPRRMTVVMRAVDPDGVPVEPLKDDVPLLDRHLTGRDENIVVLSNLLPIWNEETKTFDLNLGSRVRVPSVKNFRLLHPEDGDYTILQFGKVGDDSFTLDMRFPMTPLMALGIAITSL
ncbi:Tubby- protein 1, partial [Dipsacomyces acuminosporus]